MANIQTFEILYLDIWGNEKEGFEVNAAHNSGKFIEMTLTQYEDDDFIIHELIEMGLLIEDVHDVEIEGDNGFLTIMDRETQYPLYQLQMI